MIFDFYTEVSEGQDLNCAADLLPGHLKLQDDGTSEDLRRMGPLEHILYKDICLLTSKK